MSSDLKDEQLSHSFKNLEFNKMNLQLITLLLSSECELNLVQFLLRTNPYSYFVEPQIFFQKCELHASFQFVNTTMQTCHLCSILNYMHAQPSATQSV